MVTTNEKRGMYRLFFVFSTDKLIKKLLRQPAEARGLIKQLIVRIPFGMYRYNLIV